MLGTEDLSCNNDLWKKMFAEEFGKMKKRPRSEAVPISWKNIFADKYLWRKREEAEEPIGMWWPRRFRRQVTPQPPGVTGMESVMSSWFLKERLLPRFK